MVVGAPSGRPMELALVFRDGDIVDAGDTDPHQAFAVEFPVFIAIAAEPLAAIVMPFVGKTNGDTVIAKGPDFLDQAIIQLAVPFAGQERFDRDAAFDELDRKSTRLNSSHG